ncbi:MAG: L-threonylcarbamoyladenylate synthase [Chitinophagales bacterium]|nr:L-threonylcarbamoyladenylate synthase [Chitinophagales bacterium]MDW8392813.1 L-threonylcarbamoyladenylate synthase [Chitinophagales bacterium]
MRVSLEQAVASLRQGDVAVLPTETVYGLAGDATNPYAIARIFEVKRRPADNPLICHFPSIHAIFPYVKNIPEQTSLLMEALCPGPISFMLELPEASPLFFATCGSRQVIVRIPDHPVFLMALEALQVPLAAPSANTSGRLSPTHADMVEADLGAAGIAVVDGGACRVGLESTIVDARKKGLIRILRPGAVGKQELQELLPGVVVQDGPADATVPGSRYRHYAPATPVYCISKNDLDKLETGSLLILVDEQLQDLPGNTSAEHWRSLHLFSLGRLADPEDLARNFYRRLSDMDRLQKDAAFIVFPDFGKSSLEKALSDRLRRIVTLKD